MDNNILTSLHVLPQIPVQLSRLTVCDHRLNHMWHYNKPLPSVLERFTPWSNGSRLIVVANGGSKQGSLNLIPGQTTKLSRLCFSALKLKLITNKHISFVFMKDTIQHHISLIYRVNMWEFQSPPLITEKNFILLFCCFAS